MTNEQKQIETLLQEKIGLKKDSISSRQIAKALETRRLACNVPDLESYLRLLKTNLQEWWELLDLIVVPETWFFRHQEAFKFLHNYVKTEWLKRQCGTSSAPQPVSILKILSLPCSTGEEPYSIAMTLLDVGLTHEQFQIDAIDISHTSLQKAQKAIYGERSFREDSSVQKSRYFHRVSQSYQLCQLVRDTVEFKQGNLLDPRLPIQKSYHIIFCRHLLIYLDLSARSRAIDVLEQLLAQSGFLFVGSPETSLFKPPRFQAIDYPYAFVYQKGESEVKHRNKKTGESFSKSSSIKLTQVQKNENKTLLKKERTISPLSITHHHHEPIPNNQQSTPQNKLLEARRLADSGALEEAVSLCRIYLSQVPSDPQAYLLLGQVYQAKGDEHSAEQYFQKVIYLDPNSEEALMHLALLKESRGDLSGATLIRQRIQRLFKLRDDQS